MVSVAPPRPRYGINCFVYKAVSYETERSSHGPASAPGSIRQDVTEAIRSRPYFVLQMKSWRDGPDGVARGSSGPNAVC